MLLLITSRRRRLLVGLGTFLPIHASRQTAPPFVRQPIRKKHVKDNFSSTRLLVLCSGSHHCLRGTICSAEAVGCLDSHNSGLCARWHACESRYSSAKNCCYAVAGRGHEWASFNFFYNKATNCCCAMRVTAIKDHLFLPSEGRMFHLSHGDSVNNRPDQ
jgi:hypothetical protein